MERDPQAVDVSVVVNAHSEGNLLHRTLNAVEQSLFEAKQQGITTEVIVVCDRPSQSTLNYLSRRPATDISTLQVDFGDLGKSRNAGIAAAVGKYVAFLDGDDIWSSNWIVEAFRVAEEHEAEAILHAEYTYAFGCDQAIIRHISTVDPTFSPPALSMDNPWISSIMAPKSLFERNPYRYCPAGFGYEDWLFFCDSISDGAPVLVVPRTAKFYRRRPGSLLQQQAGALLLPSDYFRSTELPKSAIALQNAAHRTASSTTEHPQHDPCLDEDGNFLSRLFTNRSAIPKWLSAELRHIHKIDPELFPDEEFRQSRRVDRQFDQGGSALRRLTDACGADTTHIFTVPWLKRGGSDLVSLNYIWLVAEAVPDAKITVVATEREDSPWATRLPSPVKFVNLREVLSDVSEEQQHRVFSTYLVQSDTVFVHNIHSKFLFDSVEKYGRALSQKLRLFTSNFCADITSDGRRDGVSIRLLPKSLDHFEAVMSDNAGFISEMKNLYGWDDKNFFAHYQPTKPDPSASSRDYNYEPGTQLRILWAGRLDRQKRPDLLSEIARRTQNLPVLFSAYGKSALKLDRKPLKTRGLNNLEYHGGFDGFSSLPISQSHVFLNTSQWDGIPNILLEAAAHGLPIISSNVGGIGEVVQHNSTGLLVSPFDAIDLYVHQIEQIVAGEINLGELRKKAIERVKTVHSWENFRTQVEQVPHYLNAVSDAKDISALKPSRDAKLLEPVSATQDK